MAVKKSKNFILWFSEIGIEEEIKKVLKDLNTGDIHNLMRRGREVRDIIRNAEIPPGLTLAIYVA